MKTKSLLLALVCAILCAFHAVAAEGYAVYTASNHTLTFYYGTKPDGAYSFNQGQYPPDWNDDVSRDVTRVVFDPSFAQARPTITAYWFCEMMDLTTITGLNYLNTSEVTMMSYMFTGCRSLTSLDLSNFDTSKVYDMQSMFSGCRGLTSLDLRSFNTAKVKNMDCMFYYCTNLKTISVSSSWTTASVRYLDHQVFENCNSLVGGAGTTYDANHIDATYAHIDGGPSNPGYLIGEIYDLWINGVQVTGANINGVTGSGISGSVTYEPSTKTLTLNNATIDQRGLSVCAISTAYGAPANLKVKLVGENKILANPNSIAINIKESQGFTLYGSGTLDCGGALYLDARSTLVNDNAMSFIKDCSVNIDQIISEDYEECLTINNADVTTEYLNVGGDYNGNVGLTLLGCSVAYPVGGYPQYGCIFVEDQVWDGHVEIKRSGHHGDVNGDGKVNVSDVSTLINMILGITPMDETRADVNGDTKVNVSDVTALINIILGIQ